MRIAERELQKLKVYFRDYSSLMCLLLIFFSVYENELMRLIINSFFEQFFEQTNQIICTELTTDNHRSHNISDYHEDYCGSKKRNNNLLQQIKKILCK